MFFVLELTGFLDKYTSALLYLNTGSLRINDFNERWVTKYFLTRRDNVLDSNNFSKDFWRILGTLLPVPLLKYAWSGYGVYRKNAAMYDAS